MLAGCGRQPLSIGASSIRFFKIDPEDDDPIGLPCREVYTTSNVAFILVLIGEGALLARRDLFGVSSGRFGGVGGILAQLRVTLRRL